MAKKKDYDVVSALRVNLNQDQTDELEFVKKYYGIVSDSDMIRFLIRDKKKQIIEEGIYKKLDEEE